MKLLRRRFLQLAMGAAALPAVPHPAWTQAYPTRVVRWVVPYPPAGPTDIIARILCPWLSERLGQQFIVENRPGATGNVGTEMVARSLPDGHTLIAVGAPHAINATLFEKLNFDFIRDIAPIIGIMRAPLVMLVNPLVPARTVPEFIAYAKANPGRINMASAGSGSPQHVTGELFKMMTGINMLHVPYRGSAPALTDLIGGQVQLMFDTTPASIGYIRAGTLRPLAITTSSRSEALPDVPSLGDFIPGFESSSWYGLGAPKNTPVDIIEKLNSEISIALADPTIKARLYDLGGSVLVGRPSAFRQLIVDETEKWAKVVKFSGAKPD
jgi:tripartite-type tricarboxylate transporter receptor subunit TctC